MRQGGLFDSMPRLAFDILLVGLITSRPTDRSDPGWGKLLWLSGNDDVLVHNPRIAEAGIVLSFAPNILLDREIPCFLWKVIWDEFFVP